MNHADLEPFIYFHQKDRETLDVDSQCRSLYTFVRLNLEKIIYRKRTTLTSSRFEIRFIGAPFQKIRFLFIASHNEGSGSASSVSRIAERASPSTLAPNLRRRRPFLSRDFCCFPFFCTFAIKSS